MNKKNLIITASVEIIKEEGFVNFSLGKVAKKLNISKGVLTYHFPTRESLLSSIVNTYYEKAAKFMEKHIRLNNGCSDTLDSYIESCLYFASENKLFTASVVDIMLNYHFENTEKNFQNDTSSYQILIDIFKYGQEKERTFRNFSPLIMAKSIRSVIDTMSLSIARNEVNNIDEAIEEVKKIFRYATLQR